MIVRALKLYWHPDRGDNFCTATSQGELDAQAAGYTFVRVEGYVHPEQAPGTVPLKLFWSPDRGDNFCTAAAQGEQDAQAAGYTFVRVEGYVHPDAEPNTVPLKLYWHPDRGDNFCTATAQGEQDAQAVGYTLVRVEGHVLPSAAPTTANWKFFRDKVVIDQEFAAFVNAKAAALPKGSTLLIAARECQHDDGNVLKVPGCNLIVLADRYDAGDGAIDVGGLNASGQGAKGAPGKTGSDDEPGEQGGQGGVGPAGNDGGSITVFSKRLGGAKLSANGGRGGQGGAGGTGGPPHEYEDPDRVGPVWTAPGPGGTGGAGGGGGGRIIAVYVEQVATTSSLQLQADGGQGGTGGAGGAGAMAHDGRFQAPNGAAGAEGAQGQPGQASATQVTEDEYWACLRYAVGADAVEWARYRLRVGEYFFRAHRAASPYDTYRGLALDEFEAALALDPGFARARTDLDHLLGNRNILGIARDIDIFPDFERYSSFVTEGTQLVQAILQFASNDLTTGILATHTVAGLQREIDHLKSSKKILSDEEKAAAFGNQLADQELSGAEKRANEIAAQVKAKKTELDQASIDLGVVVGTVGAVLGVVAAIPTGGSSILAFAPAIAAVFSDLKSTGVLTTIKDALHLTGDEGEKRWEKLAKDAGSLKNIIQQNYAAVQNLINLAKTIDDIWNANVAKKEHKELLAKAVEVAQAQLLASWRAGQAEVLHQVAVAKQVQRDADEQAATAELERINSGIKILNDAPRRSSPSRTATSTRWLGSPSTPPAPWRSTPSTTSPARSATTTATSTRTQTRTSPTAG